MSSSDGRKFTVFIRANDIKRIFSWVMKHPNLETGGDVFGLWEKSHNSLENILHIHYIIGPGQLCRRTTFSFHQDVRYASQMEDYFHRNHGMKHVALWHSHQSGLDRPSADDKKMVWETMPSHDINRFVLIIASIADSGKESENTAVSLKCFLFEIDDKTEECLPVLLGKFRVLTAEETDWTHHFDLHDVELEAGAEFLIADEDLALSEITETETSVIGYRKREKKHWTLTCCQSFYASLSVLYN